MYYVKKLQEGTAWQLCLTFGSAVQCMPGNSNSGFHIPAPAASGKRVISSLHSHMFSTITFTTVIHDSTISSSLHSHKYSTISSSSFHFNTFSSTSITSPTDTSFTQWFIPTIITTTTLRTKDFLSNNCVM